jgi:CRISPR-associated endonuclease/helicase Cas3
LPDIKYAHSGTGLPGDGWHELGDHLRSVGELAAGFALAWNSASWGRVAGLWHDLGKAAVDWQEFLREAGIEAHVQGDEYPEPRRTGRKRGPDHSSAGAIHAGRALGSFSLPIQFAIAGHHAGLANKQDLATRLKNKQERYELAGVEANPEIAGHRPELNWPHSIGTASNKAEHRRRLETFIRMIFSALVDADFLDTERFYLSKVDAPARKDATRGAWPPFESYLPVLESFLQSLHGKSALSPINIQRQRALGWCIESAAGPQGAYSLTVPTGGGKTLSSLAFALHHAKRHGLQRVIVALPFTSILDQTATVFSEVFGVLGSRTFLEHHSAIDPKRDTAVNRLATENWDAPLILTTQVQFFESLFANRTSRCRKLHNIAGSIVILDEVQSLPASLLSPILHQLQELCRTYRMTLLLTTATQPALHSRELGSRFFHGLDPQPTEIVPSLEMEELFNSFRRVRVQWPTTSEPMSWATLAAALFDQAQVLAIVHRRADAFLLWSELKALEPESPPLHLSALMCPAHRRQVLARARGKLIEGRSCRLVSTQVIEAGVDIDFPVVYRAMAGLESLAQSAGRCNREGLRAIGEFRVFKPRTDPPVLLRLHRDIAEIMLQLDSNLDITLPATFRDYYDRLYSHTSLDVHGIQALREELRFEDTAAKFRMIDDATETVFIPYGAQGRKAVDALRYSGPSRDRFRALQPFGVAVYPNDLRKLEAAGAIELLHESAYVLVSDFHYDAEAGLRVEIEDLPLLIA